MRAIIVAAAALALSAVSANAGMDIAVGGAGHGLCLYPREVDHTQYVNPTTILFHMKDGKIFKNTLKGPCPGLAFHGFVYVAHDVDEICDNAVPIEVVESHEACSLGTFTPMPDTNPG